MSATALPPVSVIVPFFGDNRASLDRLLRSLAAQDYAGGVEIILADNHPRPALPAGFAGPRVRLVHEPEPGSYAARNAALRQAGGEIMAFTDSDCECAPDWLSRGVAAVGHDTGVSIAGGAVRQRPSSPATPSLAERYDSFFHMRQAYYVAVMGFAATANCFVRGGVFRQIGPFDHRRRSGGDREWCRRAAAAGHRVGYAPDAVVLHDNRALRELLIKARRLSGQELSDARAAGAGMAQATLVELQRYGARVRRLLDPGEELPVRDRIGFFGLATTLQAVRLAELARLGVTNAEPERR